MREIKFRGKTVHGGKWIYGHFYEDSLVNTKPRSYILIKGDTCLDPIEVIPETVGQYTGLKDKNGKEIYEGDIIFHHGSGGWAQQSTPYGGPNRSFKGEKIYIIAAECGFIGRHISSFGDSSESSPSVIINDWAIINNYDLWNNSPWGEIIGNIHSNPELLK